MASRYFDHTLVDMHLRLLPLTDFDFKLRAANGNDRAGSAKFKRRSAPRAFVDGSPYAPQQQLEIRPVARRRLLYRQSRVRADEPLPAVGDRGYFQLLLGRIRPTINKRTGGAPPFELGTPSAIGNN